MCHYTFMRLPWGAGGRADTRAAIPHSLFALILCWLFLPDLRAQPSNVIAWESTLHYGTIWKHTPKLTIRTGQPLLGQELGLRIQTRGRKSWHAWQRFPAFGVSLAHFRLGTQAHGDVVGVLPNLMVPILRRGRWLAVFRVGAGLGYVTHPYNYFTNPGQNAIGSHWNNYTQFRVGAEFRLSDYWRVQAGASLNHFSNGASTLPNFGINLPTGFAALVWAPAGIREREFEPSGASKQATHRWGGLFTAGLARVEFSVYDGPRYPIWVLSAAGFFHLTRVNRLLLGLEYEFNRGVYAWGLRSSGFQSKHEARQGATRLAVALSDEFLFGALGVQITAGVYTGSPYNRYVLSPWYSKLTTRYYFPPLWHTPLRIHAGISLKAHNTTAEYISLNAGMSWQRE